MNILDQMATKMSQHLLGLINNLFIANMQPLSFGKFPYDFDLLVEIFCGSINVFVYS